VTGAGTYPDGSVLALTAAAAPGYQFVNWTENGIQVSTNPTYTFTCTSGNRTSVANFTPVVYTITAAASPTAGGSTTGGGPYNHGSTATVVATANSGYQFTNWTEGGSTVSTNASYSFTVTSDRSLVANFTQTPVQYTIG